MQDYVHGYSNRENERLNDQAKTLSELLHHDTLYPPGSHVLEAGCGVGAQTVILAAKNPDVRFTSIDISPSSLSCAKEAVSQKGFGNVCFEVGDIFNPQFSEGAFDHVFVCFVLEHLSDPMNALSKLKRLIKPGGTITVIEGDHGSTYFHPHSDDAMKTVNCLVMAQKLAGGDSNIGRSLYPLLREAGFDEVSVSPRMVYVDSSRPWLVEGFTRNTFTAMVEGVREKALDLKLIDENTWEKGIADLKRTALEDGVFCYTFFKAIANV